MRYLKVFVDFADIIEPLQDAERGRLLWAMLKYADTGELPELKGNEKFAWVTAKQVIDREAATCKTRSENGSKGGRPKKQTKAKESKQKQKKATESKEKPIKDKDKDLLTPISPLEEAIEQFRTFRDEVKKPMTDYAVKLLRGKLEKLAPGDDETKIAIINQSIFKRWTDVYALKDDADQKPVVRSQKPVFDPELFRKSREAFGE